MKNSPGRSLLPALRLALVFLIPASGATAATFTVTNLSDSGPGSLRQAVLNANATAAADTVAFAPGLTGTITLTSNEIVVSNPLTVNGPGAAALTVSGNDQFRVFYVEKSTAATPIDVTLSGLTLTRGSGLPVHTFSFGGAVFATDENLTILNSVISDSQAGVQADPPDDGCGGNVALYAASTASGATLHVADSLLTGGRPIGLFAPASGGNLCVINGKLLLERSTLSGGDAENGGALYVQTPAAGSLILLSTLSGNDADGFGGGIYAESFGPSGTLTIESSTISGNTVSTNFGIGGGIAIDNVAVQIVQSTVSSNTASDGGGISNQGGTLQIINSTVSGNHAQRTAGGIYSAQGFQAPGSLLLRLATVADNTAGTSGGGLLIGSPSAVVQLDHAIVANGTPQDVAAFGALPATLTANYSLIEAPGTTLLVGANNHIGVDPLLAPLGSYGGPTRTHQLLPGSPALDAGNPAIPSPPATDQRGAARIQGPAVDLGAVEGGLGIVEVPTLSGLGLLLLGALLCAAGVRRLRSARKIRRLV
jgi:hypothetical protein